MTCSKICCAVDFSESSSRALALAIELARRFDGDLTLLHVEEEPPPDALLGASESPAASREEIEHSLEHLRFQALELGAPRVTTALEEGAPDSEVVRFARAGAFDLIVLGTHGRTGRRRALVGSVSEGVVRHAPCPVLVVPLEPMTAERRTR